MIAIGNDHAAIELKNAICKFLDEKNISYKNFGCNDGGKADYPLKAKEVCDAVVSGECEKGILLCGTGIGMSIAANKVKGIRACACSDFYSAKYTRLHNDANILCMGQRVIGAELAIELVDIFLSTEFEGGRHQNRVDMINDLENK